jgi:putative nucleotidyltransferase with HDIG domain
MTNAEDEMYIDKTMNREAVNKDVIDTIVETLHSRSEREKQHSITVSRLCGEIGKALRLPEPEISKLKRAGFLHDIGKITLDDSILSKDSPTDEEREKMRQHSMMGYRILNLFDDTVDLAEYVYGHHERWDGAGYPRGIKGEQIPLISRIVSVVEAYDRILNRGDNPSEERRKKAIETIKEEAGKQFDPHIAELFVQMMEKKD